MRDESRYINSRHYKRAIDKLRGMRVPIVEPPENMDYYFSYDPAKIASIDDMDLATALQAGVAQVALYIKQQYNIANACYEGISERYNTELNKLASQVMPKSLTLAEKKAIALEQNQALNELHEDLLDVKERKLLLDGWIEKLDDLQAILKQQHYRLRLKTYGSE